jgi:hypothetical protein
MIMIKKIALTILLMSSPLMALGANSPFGAKSKETSDINTKQQPYHDFAIGALLGLAHGITNRLLEHLSSFNNYTLPLPFYPMTFTLFYALKGDLYTEDYLTLDHEFNYILGHGIAQFFAESLYPFAKPDKPKALLNPRVNAYLIISMLLFYIYRSLKHCEMKKNNLQQTPTAEQTEDKKIPA